MFVDVLFDPFGATWNELRAAAHREKLDQPPYELDAPRRRVVLLTIQEVCRHRGWSLLAAHVRSNHVHVVVTAEVTPEKLMNDFKAYASRALNALGVDRDNRKRWTRHGSTRYVWKVDHLAAAVEYVLEKQGHPMARFPETRGASAP